MQMMSRVGHLMKIFPIMFHKVSFIKHSMDSQSNFDSSKKSYNDLDFSNHSLSKPWISLKIFSSLISSFEDSLDSSLNSIPNLQLKSMQESPSNFPSPLHIVSDVNQSFLSNQRKERNFISSSTLFSESINFKHFENFSFSLRKLYLWFLL